MTPSRWTRRLALATCLTLPALLAACSGDDAPRSFARPNYDYLTKLRLNVASVDVDDSLPPGKDPRDMTLLAPIKPVDALRQMAQDRLVPGASSGHAVFVIDEASIVQVRDELQGRMTVHLDITTSDGTRTGYAEARVSRNQTFSNDRPNAMRATLDELVQQMMGDMNVEFEFQVRRSLRAYLQTTAPEAPESKPVQSEDLAPPPKL